MKKTWHQVGELRHPNCNILVNDRGLKHLTVRLRESGTEKVGLKTKGQGRFAGSTSCVSTRPSRCVARGTRRKTVRWSASGMYSTMIWMCELRTPTALMSQKKPHIEEENTLISVARPRACAARSGCGCRAGHWRTGEPARRAQQRPRKHFIERF